MSNVLEIMKDSKKASEKLSADEIRSLLEEVGSLKLTGNILPHAWYHTIVFDNGKTDTLGMFLLSEILYWYKPTLIMDESTGAVKGIAKKFKADKFQRSNGEFAKKYNASKDQVADALARLTKKGLITREFRTITTELGVKINNVQYLMPVVSVVIQYSTLSAELLSDEKESFKSSNDSLISLQPLSNLRTPTPTHFESGRGVASNPTPIRFETDRVSDSKGGPYPNPEGDPIGFKSDTYTKNTTRNTTAAEATKKTAQTQSSKNSPNFAAAAANFSHVKKENDFTVPMQVPTSPTGNIQREPKDSVIGEFLSEYQKAYVLKKIEQLPSGTYLSSLADEIMAGVLDKQCFASCRIDFHRKVNAIMQSVEKGAWNAPASMYQATCQKKEATQKEVDTQLNQLKEACNEALQQYTHWGRMVDFHEKSEQTALSIQGRSSSLMIQLKAWEDLRKADNELKAYAPNMKFPALPPKPITDELYEGEIV